VGSLYGLAGVRYASLWGPWATYPAETPPATVTVPYSAVQAGIIARVDRGGNPNAPAAGADGIARLAVGLTQTFTDEDRQALNELGVDLAKVVYGQVRSYGYRTAAGPLETNWLWFGNSRTLMAIAWECEAVCETYVLKQIDGRGQLFSRLNKDLRGVCARYYAMNALYGDEPADAYDVDTGPGINTVDTIKNGEVHAVVKVKCSPAAEWVVLEIVKVAVDRPVSVAVAA
jgi:phage tail sheath protein FI